MPAFAGARNNAGLPLSSAESVDPRLAMPHHSCDEIQIVFTCIYKSENAPASPNTFHGELIAKPAYKRDQPLSPPARAQPGGLVPLE